MPTPSDSGLSTDPFARRKTRNNAAKLEQVPPYRKPFLDHYESRQSMLQSRPGTHQ